MTPTKEQLDILAFLEDPAFNAGTLNLLIEALAGTGKTQSLRLLIAKVKQLFPSWRIRYLVFNKKNEEEFKLYDEAKLEGVTAKTINACGFEVCREYSRFIQTKSNYKTKDCLQVELERYFPKDRAEQLSFFFMSRYEQAFGLLKNACIDEYKGLSSETLSYLEDNFDFEVPYPEELERAGIDHEAFFSKVYEETHFHSTFDFTDQFYRPLRFDWTLTEKFDLVLVDECQDLSKAKTEFIRTLGDRFIFVGDTNQTIYGFSGANPNNMKYVEETFNCKSLPLSVNWRCSTSVIAEAQKFTPLIQACPMAPTGEVKTIKESQLLDYVNPGDLVLCRTNAPCLESAISLMISGRHCTIFGKSFAEDMQKAFEKIAKSSTPTLSSFEESTKKYFTTRLAKIKSRQQKLEVTDQFQAFIALIESQRKKGGYEGLKHLLNSLFSKYELGDGQYSKNTISYSSIHKSKGLEFPQVFLIRPSLLPHPFVSQNAFPQLQERNLEYVSLTRAKVNFYYVKEDE